MVAQGGYLWDVHFHESGHLEWTSRLRKSGHLAGEKFGHLCDHPGLPVMASLIAFRFGLARGRAVRALSTTGKGAVRSVPAAWSARESTVGRPRAARAGALTTPSPARPRASTASRRTRRRLSTSVARPLRRRSGRCDRWWTGCARCGTWSMTCVRRLTLRVCWCVLAPVDDLPPSCGAHHGQHRDARREHHGPGACYCDAEPRRSGVLTRAHRRWASRWGRRGGR